MTEISISEFLDRAKQVTANYQTGIEFEEKDQFAKITEELSELMKAKTSLEDLEEGCDIIFSVLTLFHIKGYDNYAIKTALLTTLKKIETRSQTYLSTGMVHKHSN